MPAPRLRGAAPAGWRRVLAALVLGSAVTGPALAQDLRVTRSVESGVPSVVAHERSWDRDCRTLPVSVTVTRAPAHGTVTMEHASSVIPASTPRMGSTGRCAGKPVTGEQIAYRAHPGFRGTDTLAYSVAYGGGRSGSTTITIDVR